METLEKISRLYSGTVSFCLMSDASVQWTGLYVYLAELRRRLHSAFKPQSEHLRARKWNEFRVSHTIQKMEMFEISISQWMACTYHFQCKQNNWIVELNRKHQPTSTSCDKTLTICCKSSHRCMWAACVIQPFWLIRSNCDMCGTDLYSLALFA